MRIYGITDGNPEEYLVIAKDYYSGEVFCSIQTAMKIIDRIDMSDCTYEELKVYRLTWDKEPERLVVHGAWHDPSTPLYIKVTDVDGNTVFDGYGTDH